MRLLQPCKPTESIHHENPLARGSCHGCPVADGRYEPDRGCGCGCGAEPFALWRFEISGGFKAFDYANPAAPKGGTVKLAAIGSFDSLNPFILKGVPAAELGLLFDTLAVASDDEPFSRYGLVAETMEVAADKSWIIFNLNSKARFRDGSPITAEDVAFSFDILKTKGNPLYRLYYADVAKSEILSASRIKFSFSTKNNRELPLILTDLPIFSKKWYSNRAFDETNLVEPMTSGPYSIERIVPGRTIVLKRNPDYWRATWPSIAASITSTESKSITIAMIRCFGILEGGEFRPARRNLGQELGDGL